MPLLRVGCVWQPPINEHDDDDDDDDDDEYDDEYGRLPEKLQLIELAAYANQTKLIFKLFCIVGYIWTSYMAMRVTCVRTTRAVSREEVSLWNLTGGRFNFSGAVSSRGHFGRGPFWPVTHKGIAAVAHDLLHVRSRAHQQRLGPIAHTD